MATSDADRVASYAARQPDFGGIFFDRERLVVLFTGGLERHEESLRGIVERPEQLLVRPATRTFSDVQRARDRVEHLLMTSPGVEGVCSVAIGTRNGQFVVEVGLDPYDDVRATRLREIVYPEQVVVTPRRRPRPL